MPSLQRSPPVHCPGATSPTHDLAPRNWDAVLVALYEHVVICRELAGDRLCAVARHRHRRCAQRPRVVYRASIAFSGLLYTIPTLAFLALLIPDRRTRPRQRDHLHGGLLADDPHPQHRHRHPRRAARCRRRGTRHGHERSASSCGASELPLAAPIIVAGVRIAAVTVISVAVVAAYVNAGGLGTLIFNGISNDHAPKIWVGALDGVRAGGDRRPLPRRGSSASCAGGARVSHADLVEAWQFIVAHPDRFFAALVRARRAVGVGAGPRRFVIAVPIGIAVAARPRAAR